jgi:mycothiol synthase
MSVSEPKPPQLQMVWPVRRLDAPPAVRVATGYAVRTYRPGDEARFYELLALAGWPGWDEDKLKPYLARTLSNAWFFAVHEESDLIVASAMGIHDHSDQHPFGGELGWVAGDPAHAGKGLGAVVCGAVTARLLSMCYRDIHLYTDDWRLPALKTYLKLGYEPLLFEQGMPARWQVICETLGWPYTPDAWPT